MRGRASNVPTPVKSGSLPVTERVVIQPASVAVPEPVAQTPPPAAVEPKSPVEAQAAPAAEAQGTEGKTEKKRKPRWTEEQKEAAKAARAAAKKDKKKKKKKKKKSKSKSKSGDDSDDEKDAEPAPPKKLKLIPLEPEDRVSGPANTEEAQRMRSALGFAPAPEAVAVPAQPAVHDGGFSFGFQPAVAAAETPRAFAAPAQEGPAPKAVSSSSDDSSSSSSDDSSSEDEAEPRRAAPAAPAAPAPTTPAPAAGLAEAGGEQLVPRRVYVGGMPYRYTREQARRCSDFLRACSFSLQRINVGVSAIPQCTIVAVLTSSHPPNPIPLPAAGGVLELLWRDREHGDDDLPRHWPLQGHRVYHLCHGGRVRVGTEL